MTGFTRDEYGEIADALSAATEGLIDADEEIPLPEEPTSRRGDLWILGGKHRVYCGDSTQKGDVDAMWQGGGYT